MIDCTIELSSYTVIVHDANRTSRRLKERDDAMDVYGDPDGIVESIEEAMYCDECFPRRYRREEDP